MKKRLSKNFMLHEFEVSEKGRKLGLDNTMPEKYHPNVQLLVDKLLQPFLDFTGWQDKINSGYRSDKVNEAVGGVSTSQHRTAEASDNMFFKKNEKGSVIYLQPIEVLKKIIESKLEFDQCILYNGFVHLSFSGNRKNRMQVLYNKNYTGKRL